MSQKPLVQDFSITLKKEPSILLLGAALYIL